MITARAVKIPLGPAARPQFLNYCTSGTDRVTSGTSRHRVRYLPNISLNTISATAYLLVRSNESPRFCLTFIHIAPATLFFDPRTRDALPPASISGER